MDELSTLGPSHIAGLKPDGTVENSMVLPEQLGLGGLPIEARPTGSAVRAAEPLIIVLQIGEARTEAGVIHSQ